jgi:hypothetical protein
LSSNLSCTAVPFLVEFDGRSSTFTVALVETLGHIRELLATCSGYCLYQISEFGALVHKFSSGFESSSILQCVFDKEWRACPIVIMVVNKEVILF